MDWLNLHISVLDSPQVLRCDPVRRATWLFLLRYCIGQENGGIIDDCRAWGDTTWQQLARVKLKEVSAECPLWTWDGDSLRVTFYPSEKQTEVQEKRTLARENGRRGGRPRKTEDNRQITNVGYSENPTSVISNNPDVTQSEPRPKAEGKGKEGKGKEVSPSSSVAPSPTPPQDDDDPTGFMNDMQAAPEPAHVTQACDRRTFGDWRTMIAHRIFWTREEDEVWKGVYQAEGWDEMTKAYAYLAGKHPAPKKLFLNMFQDLRA